MFATIRMFNAQRGFGFLRNPTGADDWFFHFSEVKGLQKEDIKPEMLVEFSLGEHRGKPVARDLRPVTLETVGGAL
jgi:cold shock CspA family protein